MSIPDRFQYFFDDSGNFQNFVKIWTRNPPNCCQFTLKNTRKSRTHTWTILFLQPRESRILKMLKVMCTKNLGDFCFPLIFNGILMPNWGFNYSKMAKYRFLIDSNTFLTILGTSKILSKSGPVTLPIVVNLL